MQCLQQRFEGRVDAFATLTNPFPVSCWKKGAGSFRANLLHNCLHRVPKPEGFRVQLGVRV